MNDRTCARCGRKIKTDSCETCNITYSTLAYKGKQYNNVNEVQKAVKKERAARRKRLRETSDYFYYKRRMDYIKARKKQREQDNNNFKHNQKTEKPNKKITEYFK